MSLIAKLNVKLYCWLAHNMLWLRYCCYISHYK